MSEVTLERDGQVALRFAVVNGFRNIQNLVQKLKKGKCPYQYVEVMACPAGCLNGGAQIRPTRDKAQRQLTAELETMYSSLSKRQPVDNPLVTHLYDTWLDGCDSDKCATLLRTQYHSVQKSNTPLNIKW